MLNVEYVSQFKKDLKLVKKRGKALEKLETVMEDIAFRRNLDAKLRDHALTGKWTNYRELHIESDWLLIYRLELSKNTVVFVRTGSHSDLF